MLLLLLLFGQLGQPTKAIRHALTQANKQRKSMHAQRKEYSMHHCNIFLTFTKTTHQAHARLGLGLG
jgi:hypothetical protein